MSELTCLYGFVPLDAPDMPPELVGQEGRAVERIELPGFAAVISRVPAATWSAEALDARVRDLAWVAERGLEHERVVAWFVDHAHIIPVPLFTLYSSVDALRRAIAARADEIASQLRRFEGLREWDLKVGYDASTLLNNMGELSAEIRAFDDELAAAPPGRRYLLEKKRATVAASMLADVARREASALLDHLTSAARAVRSLPLPRADQDVPVVLYAAFLLDNDGEPAAIRTVSDRMEALGRVGISVDWSGPWAPYRFLGPADG